MSTADTKTTEKTTEQVRKNKALEAALQNIRREYGDESLADMSGPPRKVPAISSGVLPLDIALGIGGVPKGRIVEVYGPESAGKTTLMYHLFAEVQKRDGVAAFIDAEHSMDVLYARNLGVHIEDLIVSQPDYGEQALQIAQLLVESGAVDLVAIDSVAALTPKAEIEGQIGDQSVGAQARMMSQAMRILASKAAQSKTAVVFTNQIREKVGVFFGSPETQPGGRALKFFASQRMEIRRIETIKEGTESVGNRVRVKVVKNKVAAPYKQAEFVISFGIGVDRLATLIEMQVADKDLEGVTKSGAFYTFKRTGDKAQQGLSKAKAYLAEHPEVANDLENEIRHLYLDEGHDITDSVRGKDIVDDVTETETAATES